MVKHTNAVLLLLLLPLTSLAAEETPSIEPGARVRIKAHEIRYRGYMYKGRHWIEGSVVSLNADTLVLKVKLGGNSLAIPRASITKFEMSWSRGAKGERWEVVPLPIHLAPPTDRPTQEDAKAEQERTRFEARGTLGYAGFGDDGKLFPHFVVGGSLRVYLIQNFGLEPQFLYMHRDRSDQHSHFRLNAILAFTNSSKKVRPYIMGGIGRYSSDNKGAPNSSVGVGFGIRISITEQLFISPEAGLSSLGELRLTASLGISGLSF